MKKLFILWVVLVGGGLLFENVNDAFAWNPPTSVREIPVPGLPDVAITSIDRLGSIIYFNPSVVSTLPSEIVSFFKAHEYGHVYLGHIQQSFFANNPYSQAWSRTRFENEADCFAARELADSEPASVIAAVNFFISQGTSKSSSIYPTGLQRAANIRSCAGMSSPPQTPPTPYCCDIYGNRRCQINEKPGPFGSPCSCAGIWGLGTTCP